MGGFPITRTSRVTCALVTWWCLPPTRKDRWCGGGGCGIVAVWRWWLFWWCDSGGDGGCGGGGSGGVGEAVI